MSNEPIIPSLHNSIGFITDKHERAAYLVRHFIMNPGGTSDFFEGHKLSLRMLAANYGDSPDTLCRMSEQQLQDCMKRNFPNDNTTVEVTSYNTENYKYGIKINVAVIDTQTGKPVPLVLSENINITDDLRIQTNF